MKCFLVLVTRSPGISSSFQLYKMSYLFISYNITISTLNGYRVFLYCVTVQPNNWVNTLILNGVVNKRMIHCTIKK